MLIINADDWGRDPITTDRTLECVLAGRVTSVSAMVFMEDSERAATLARRHDVDAGLHLNLTAAFTGRGGDAALAEDLRRVSGFLRSHSLARLLFHPALARPIRRLKEAQVAEFRRLYGRAPARIDGHHHAHLCTNVLAQGLLGDTAIVRRNFTFERGEKSWFNRAYRGWVDRRLARRHRVTDYLFSILPLEDSARLERIIQLARTASVELETHPVQDEERELLLSDAFRARLGDVRVPRYAPLVS
jgi:predicted glycoside hydrolase/deacetylase ChbG (UPF0249 family)